MRYLLDTHALIWWMTRDRKLPPSVRDLMADRTNAIFCSAVSAYEISLKVWLGKLEISPSLLEHFGREIGKDDFVELPLTAAHASEAGLLETDHRDPFDRMLMAQAVVEDLTIISVEARFDALVRRFWG